MYTETVKRDIQKRYYLKYPWLAYRIGKGSQYEVLDIRVAVSEMVSWCAVPPSNAIRILKDASLLDTATVLRAEKNAGRARIVLSIPRWAVVWGYAVLRKCCPDKKLLYLLGKAVHPLRSE